MVLTGRYTARQICNGVPMPISTSGYNAGKGLLEILQLQPPIVCVFKGTDTQPHKAMPHRYASSVSIINSKISCAMLN